MKRAHAVLFALTMLVLVAIPIGLVIYKLMWLDYRISDVLPRTRYNVTVAMTLDGHDTKARVRTFAPLPGEHQQIVEEKSSAPTGVRFASEVKGLNREALWSGGRVSDRTAIQYSFSVLGTAQHYHLDPDLSVPAMYPASIAPYLRPEPDIQVDDPAIAATLAELGAERGPLTERLRRIYEYTASLPQRPFKGTTDALTALRLGEASCNGKSRLFVALARATGIPARLVGGLVLTGGKKRTSHQWVEAYVGGHWVPFGPTNRHFAELPENYLVLYRGDEALFRHTRDINFDYAFSITRDMVPPPKARETLSMFNVWAMFDRLGLPFSLLRTVLMLPVGALVVVLFRNVIGMPTFGTFLPALIAVAAGETGLLWGVVGILIVMASVGLVRSAMRHLELLHSPTLAILLAVVVLSMLGTSLVAEKLELMKLAKLSFFPIAVMAIASERFYLALVEQGGRIALEQLTGTLIVVLGCYVVMNSLALQILLSGFPEVLLLVVAANVYLGRWIGIRLLEYLRFRRTLMAEGMR